MIEIQTETKRLFALGALMAAVAIQFSAFWFYDTFTWNRNTTAYIPFLAWAKGYSDPGSVLNLFYGISGFALILGFCAAYELGRLK